MSENAEVIKVEGLTKVYNHNLTAVDHINFSVKQGEIFSFLRFFALVVTAICVVLSWRYLNK